MLKQSLLGKLISTLDKSPFTAADFTVTPGESEGQPIVQIVFRHDERFRLEVTRHYSGEFVVTESPGEYLEEEEIRMSTLDKLPERLLNWTRNVRDELRSSLPIYSELDEIREKIQQHIDDHVNEPEDLFSREEAEILREKLDQLAQKFDELAERSEITVQELNRVQQELNSIKANIGTFPKGTWYKTAGTKLWAVTSKIVTSAESRGVIAQAARKAIGLDDAP